MSEMVTLENATEQQLVSELRSRYRVVIMWSPEDVQTLRPSWSYERCLRALEENAKHLQDRSIEHGWNVLESLLGYEMRA